MKTETVIAANRFGLGARPGELEAIDRDPRTWLLKQIDGPAEPAPALRGLPETAELVVEARRIRQAQRDAQRKDDEAPSPDIVEKYGAYVRRNYIRQMTARYRAAAASEQPFRERLVHFWSNHFAVSADKQPLPAIAGLYENEAIRPNITGKFADLLLAAEQHPAMILYLDNQRSIGPASKLAKRASRRRSDRRIGLNENLAREILELHTLGVNGGYSQQDVTSLAAVITGWSIGGADDRGRFADGEPGRFEFREAIHEPGAKAVLGKTYADNGLAQGEAVLRDLATHPATAQFLAFKLARHFVADEPPPALVERMAAVYLDTGGELSAVYTSLIEAQEAWQKLFAKYKTPHEFVVSALRAFDHVPDDSRFLIAALDLMGQPPFKPGSPEGWPDTAEQWGGADALYKRIEWAGAVGEYVGTRVNPVVLGDTVLGPAFNGSTRKVVSRAESASQGTTLLLASPAFQRR